MTNENKVPAGPAAGYEGIIAVQETRVARAVARKKTLGWARLFSVAAGIIVAWAVWPAMIWVATGITFFCLAFMLLVIRDSRWSAEKREAEALISINRHELDSLEYHMEGYDAGTAFAEAAHAYAGDLDLFGPSSLYQWINRASGDPGKTLLAAEMKNGLPREMIVARQQAVAELADKTDWTQQFRLKSMEAPLKNETRGRIGNWLTQPEQFLDKPVWKRIILLHSLTGMSLLTLWLLDVFPMSAFNIGFLVLAFIAYNIGGKLLPMYSLLSKTAPEMEGLYGQLSWLESAAFESPHLQELQQKNKTDSSSPTTEMKQLYAILKRFDIKLNLIVGTILNIFFLWDLRQALALRKWKTKNRAHLPRWIGHLAEMEVLISLAALKHNQPAWSFPDTGSPYFLFSAENFGHPLIAEDKRVNQSFTLSGPGRTAIITGANMAGKSTFLRSLGINAVLAFMGAPVCASSMRISRSELITSMRVTDNLAENTSTFYAELKKLEYIIGRVNAGAELFILLDEVLRGTNSEDRHSGTTALVRQLLRGKTTSVIATHDTQLARTESERSPAAVDNYHFDGTVTGSELSFDYRLKTGICVSLNATALMKKIGIQIGE